MIAAPRLALVAVGANLGHAEETVAAAMKELCTWSEGRSSSLWRTIPENCPPGAPPFVNAAVALVAKSEWTPEALLARLHALERAFGRISRTVKNESRTLDLDLIAFGDEVREGSLVLPHPRAHLRSFVLLPLAEVAPTFVWPSGDGRGFTVQALLDALPKSDAERATLPSVP